MLFNLLIKLAVVIGSEFMSTTTSTRHLNLIVISVLSHTVGVSFKEVLVNFVHGTVKFFVQIKAVSSSKKGYKVLYFD